ncbi:hypothetical protein DVH05_000595 [Phytophthora capsici]|nr:hypothetical protein DVH05_000595 [Phytophthora capsici]
MAYPACPERHQPEFYCCSTSPSSREVYTKFRRPIGGDYEEDYRLGWNEPRQVNFPYVRYTPDTPIFTYDDPETVCRMQTVVIDFKTGELQQKLQCGRENSSLVADSRDDSVFWTSPTNPRNNNASFPIGAHCESLMLADGSVDEDRKISCVSDRQRGDFQFTTFSEPPLVAVYFVYLICFVLLAWWNIHRRKNCSVIDEDKSALDFKGIISRPPYELISEANSRPLDLIQTGYSSSRQGQLVFGYFVLVTIFLHVLLIIIICDYYESFNPHLFDPESASATVFFLVWIFAAVWLIAVVLYQQDILNFFRVPSPLSQCDFVHMLKTDDTEIIL